MDPESIFQPGLLEIPVEHVPDEYRQDAVEGYVVGLVTEVKVNVFSGVQTVRIDLETVGQAAKRILEEHNG